MKRLKRRLVAIHAKRKELNPIIKKVNRDEKAVLLLLTPTHVNLGDHAIAMAEMRMFDRFSINYIEITDHELSVLKRYKKLDIFNKRNILFHGGGYLGDIWLNVELLCREIVSENPDSKIIFSPNTIYYKNDDQGHFECMRSIDVYNQHRNLIFYARETISYEYMKGIYNDVRLCPDMVLSLNMANDQILRCGCLVCLRNDIERTLRETDWNTIITQVENAFGTNYRMTDMYSEKKFDISDREIVLEKKFDEFRKSQIVITDRLHGMIFAAITETPCIIIDSLSPKIRGCYKWIKDLGYIRFCDDLSRVSSLISELLIFDRCEYDEMKYTEMYSELMKTITC